MATCVVLLFGGFALESAPFGKIEVPGRKAQALIAYLALCPGMSATRDKLAELFWADRDPAHSRNSLRQTLASVRRALADAGLDLLLTRNDVIGLRADRFDCDVHRFERAVALESPDDVEAAASMYTGSFLDGFFSGSPAFDDWATSQRVRLADLAIVTLERLARHFSGERGLAYARQCLALDPTRETSYRLNMELLAAAGHREGALRMFEACRVALKKEFGIEPSEPTLRLRKAILEGVYEAGPRGPEKTPTLRQTATGDETTSIAVLRFLSLSGSQEEKVFARGLFLDLITELSQYREYVVLSGTLPPGADPDALAAAGLNSSVKARFLLTGGVQRIGECVRVTVHLVESASGQAVWAQRFEDVAYAIDFRDKIARSVALAARLELHLMSWRVRDRSPTGGPEVRRLVNQALTHYYEMNRQSLIVALELSEQALSIDPGNARAQRTLAGVLCVSKAFGVAPTTFDATSRALTLAQSAANSVPQDEISRLILAYALLCDNQHDQAFAELMHALHLNPHYASAYGDLAEQYALQGRTEDALKAAEKGVALTSYSPIDFWRHYGVALARFAAGDDWNALETARKIMRSKPDFLLGALNWAAAAAATNNLGEAEGAIERCLSQMPGLRLSNVSPGLAPRYVNDRHQGRFLDMLRKAGLPP